ncbi:MAG: DUF3298 and DUF4163 domain-containing protein [Clostridia bacterium]|nr:DUF3298 and DUF4163 domain-containing protein [Clostridia bacterium]
MNKILKYILILTIFIFFLFSAYFANRYVENISVQVSTKINNDEMKSLSVAVNKDDYVVQKKEESTEITDVSIYYPVTKYNDLNKEITRIISEYKKDFESFIDVNYLKGLNIKASFEVRFNVYNYIDYVSYVFYITQYSGGAHPASFFHTISYDKKNKKIIGLEDLIKDNRSLLVELSEYTYKELLKNDILKEIQMEEMLKEGTKPTTENFRNFVFTSTGLLIFFEKYQIAPYVAGEFSVTIPYDKIHLKL